MKTYFLRVIAVTFAFLSCSKALSDEVPEFNIEQSWTIGADHSLDTVLEASTSASGTAELAIEAYSICPTHQVQLTVYDDVQVIFETISDTLMVETFTVPSNAKNLKIQAKLIEFKQGVACVWLGQANLVYRYLQ